MVDYVGGSGGNLTTMEEQGIGLARDDKNDEAVSS